MLGAPHFSYAEFDCHDGTKLPRHARGDVRRLCRDYLEPLRERFGPVAVHSGYRSPAWNRAVSGAPSSYHVARRLRRGAAADVSCALGAPADWYELLDELGAPGLHAYESWVHVDTRAAHARW